MGPREEVCCPAAEGGQEVGPAEGVGAEAGPALKPRERSSGTAARIAEEEEEEAAQSAKAPESEANWRLVVATTDLP